jgi:hypothetical protein
MELSYLWFLLLPIFLVGALLLILFVRGNVPSPAQARARFEQRRDHLQSAFFQAASTSGKPRGLRWKECQWQEQIELVRDKQTGQLHALVGVTISFEAIEGGDMEGVEAVGNLRDASAVFYFDGEWKTGGRVIFNLTPADAVEHFKGNYERA